MDHRMNRRRFVALGAAAGAGALLPPRGSAAVAQGAMSLPASPGFATRHLVVVILGGGARKRDVLSGSSRAPRQRAMAAEGTLFTEDYGETSSLHGYMTSELLTGRDAPAQRPLFPTWSEYVRKKTGAPASDFWMLQGVSFYRGWTWDVKHYSQHPDYGPRYGATSFTADKMLRFDDAASPRELVERHVERRLGHSARERVALEEFLADARSRGRDLPATRRPCPGRGVLSGDCQSLWLAGQVLRVFKPRIVTVQVLGLDEAHAELGPGDDETGFDRYIDHVERTDELIGELWSQIRADPYFRATTALVVRPDCGRDGQVDALGQLGHSPGDYDAHHVWTMALGPDFERGRVVRERVQRRDLAPTLAYLMTGEEAEHATGHVRTQMFLGRYHLPRYVLPPTAAMPPVLDWKGSPRIQGRARRPASATG